MQSREADDFPAPQRDAFGRLTPDAPLDFTDPFVLSEAVGRDRPNRRNDVGKLEALLALAERDRAILRSGPTGYFDEAVEDAIRRHQRRQGLAVDGWVAPDGETLRSLRARALDEARIRWGEDRPPTDPARIPGWKEENERAKREFERTDKPDPWLIESFRAVSGWMDRMTGKKLPDWWEQVGGTRGEQR